jgi:hypothetical protein
MMYLDGEITQAWFDDYYLTQYSTDDKPYSDERLNSLAQEIASHDFVRSVLDIGGTDGELVKRLPPRVTGYVEGVEDKPMPRFRSVVLSHTLEHIYDVPAMMHRVKTKLMSGGYVFIEVPVWTDYADLSYDCHWQHINKFRARDLEKLTGRHFNILESKSLPDYREYHTWRLVAQYPGLA